MRFNGLGPGGKPNPLKRRDAPQTTILVETAFSPNPGNLRMFTYVPPGLKAGAPLVVVLHGCGQTAGGYDFGTGWSQLAARTGFVVLAVEQKALNNPNTCFNWFNPEDIRRGEGEAASIAAMIGTMVKHHALDPARVFITGLSAGGAMTAVMLATYPELFAGGAIIAGLPFGAASGVRDALDNMRSAPLKTPGEWGDLVRAASKHKGPWPKISIWHGALDTTVNVNNAQASVAQWAELHGLKLTAAKQEMVDGAIRLNWDDRLEVYTIPAMGHGTPIDSRTPAPFILQAGISSTTQIAQFWGLLDKAVAKPRPAPVRVVPVAEKPALPEIETALAPMRAASTKAENIIRRALKAAGLLPKR
ncbi:MAG: PHB depolymerase family esterase [Pseudomonadota bacterium]